MAGWLAAVLPKLGTDTKGGSGQLQGSSGFNRHKNHLEGLLKHRLPCLTLESLTW